MQALFVYGKPVTVKYTPGAAVAAGNVVVIGNVPLVAHEDIPAFTGGPMTDALAVGGGVYQLTAALAITLGQKVYWDNAAKNITTTAAGNTLFGILVAGPTGDAANAGPAVAGDACYVLHAPQG